MTEYQYFNFTDKDNLCIEKLYAKSPSILLEKFKFKSPHTLTITWHTESLSYHK